MCLSIEFSGFSPKTSLFNIIFYWKYNNIQYIWCFFRTIGKRTQFVVFYIKEISTRKADGYFLFSAETFHSFILWKQVSDKIYYSGKIEVKKIGEEFNNLFKKDSDMFLEKLRKKYLNILDYLLQKYMALLHSIQDSLWSQKENIKYLFVWAQHAL